MDRARETSGPGAARIDSAVFLDRFAEELTALGRMSRDLQEGLHSLPLERSDGHTRKLLQSADRVTQSLMCLSAAVSVLSTLPLASEGCDLDTVLEGVFLEDLRCRLAGEPVGGAGEPMRTPPGEVDLF